MLVSERNVGQFPSVCICKNSRSVFKTAARRSEVRQQYKYGLMDKFRKITEFAKYHFTVHRLGKITKVNDAINPGQ